MKKFILAGLVLPLFLSASCQGFGGSCPSEDEVREAVTGLISGNYTVEDISPLKQIRGLCQVVVKVRNQPIVFYIDPEAKYILAGNLLEIETRKNLTREVAREYMKVDENILAELEKRVNFTYGEGTKYIYYITDPDCPFCKRTEPILEEFAKKHNVKIKVILFPLPIHPEAFAKSVGLICDKKGFKELMSKEELEKLYKKYKDEKKQCEAGKKAVRDNLQFLTHQMGVTGTPTLVGMNGKIISGVPREEDLLELIN